MENTGTEAGSSTPKQEEEDADARIAASEADIAAGHFTKGSATELMAELEAELSDDETSEKQLYYQEKILQAMRDYEKGRKNYHYHELPDEDLSDLDDSP